MFFIGIFGIGEKLYPVSLHHGDMADCTACGGINTVSGFVARKYFHIFFIPLFYWGEKKLLKCSGCGSVFDPGDAGGFKRNSRPACAKCGMVLPEGAASPGKTESAFRFCPYCGERIG